MSEEPTNVHASLVLVGGKGILLRGAAGSGKSSLALSLLRAAARENRDAALVADDRVDLRVEAKRLFGAAPAALKGLIEIAGIGIVRLPDARGEAPIDLVAELREDRDRLPEPLHATILGVELPRILLPARQAALAADIVLTLALEGVEIVDEDVPPAHG